MPANARVVRALLARAKVDAALFDRYEKRCKFSGRAGSRMRPIVQLVRRQRTEYADKPRVFLLPSPDEKLSNVIRHIVFSFTPAIRDAQKIWRSNLRRPPMLHA